MEGARLRYEDVFPYAVPEDLDMLRGPAGGVVELPITAHWGPDPRFSLETRPARLSFYRTLLNQAPLSDLIAYANKDILIDLWPSLRLPRQCRDKWEAAHPELARERG